MTRLFALVLCILVAACAQPEKTATPEPGPTPNGQRELAIVVAFFGGTWDALALPGHVPMRMRMVEFWKGTPNDHWMYAEYVDPKDESRPVRQRIYRFSERGRLIYGRVYAVPAGRVGEWRKPQPFADLSPRSLQEMEGCRVIFERRHEALFAGGTDGNRCRGDLPGVAYERSEFFLSSATLKNTEHGFDAAGKRIAGQLPPWEFRKTGREVR